MESSGTSILEDFDISRASPRGPEISTLRRATKLHTERDQTPTPEVRESRVIHSLAQLLWIPVAGCGFWSRPLRRRRFDDTRQR